MAHSRVPPPHLNIWGVLPVPYGQQSSCYRVCQAMLRPYAVPYLLLCHMHICSHREPAPSLSQGKPIEGAMSPCDLELCQPWCAGQQVYSLEHLKNSCCLAELLFEGAIQALSVLAVLMVNIIQTKQLVHLGDALRQHISVVFQSVQPAMHQQRHAACLSWLTSVLSFWLLGQLVLHIV